MFDIIRDTPYMYLMTQRRDGCRGDNMVDIKGTDKQIKWAVSIRESILASLPYAARYMSETLVKMSPQHPAEMVEMLVSAYMHKLETALCSIESSRTWIDNRLACTMGGNALGVELVKMLTTGTSCAFVAWLVTGDDILALRAAVKAHYDAIQAELAAAEAEVEAVETAEAAEIAASEDAIETATGAVSDAAPAQTLSLYRLTVRCSDCCKRTKSSAREIAHYPWCTTLAQDPELLRTLQDKIAMSLIKRRETKAAKLNAKIDDLREAFSAIYTSVGGNSALGIHKINGSTGLHTVRAYEGTCTCPGHKAHGHCKHVRLVRDARDAMQSIKRQLQDTSDRLLVLAERATYANCEW
jgi:hypothetical protein